MKPARTLAVLVLALTLWSCIGTGSAIIVDSLCNTASSVLTVLTVQKAKGKLTTVQITTIDTAVEVIGPVCSADQRPSSQQAIEAVENGLLILQGVKGVQ